MRTSQNFGDSVEASRDDLRDALGGTYPGDPWVSYVLRPDDARSLAALLAAEHGDAGFTADAANLEAAADWAEGVDDDDERPGLRIVVVERQQADPSPAVDSAARERELHEKSLDRPRRNSVTWESGR